MTIIDFMMAHPFISLFMAWIAGKTIKDTTYHIANTISIRGQLKRGIPIAQVIQLNGKKSFLLELYAKDKK